MKVFSFRNSVLVGLLPGFIALAWPTSDVKAGKFDFNVMAEVVESEYSKLVDVSVDEARAWMSDQNDPQLKALALIPALYLGGDIDPEAERGFLDHFDQILTGRPDAATLFFLALACEGRFLMSECINQGLADVVQQIDPNNLATWLTLYREQPESLVDSVGQAQYFDTFFAESVNGWLQALDASTQPINEYTKIAMPHSLILAVAIPAFQQIYDVCEVAVSTEPDSGLSERCVELSQKMTERGRSLMEQNIGIGLQYRLAEIIQPVKLTEIDQHRSAFSDQIMCLGRALEFIQNEPNQARVYIRSLLEHSEFRAMQIMAEQQGIECDE